MKTKCKTLKLSISISAIFLCFGLLENIYITIPIPNATGARKSTSSDTY